MNLKSFVGFHFYLLESVTFGTFHLPPRWAKRPRPYRALFTAGSELLCSAASCRSNRIAVVGSLKRQNEYIAFPAFRGNLAPSLRVCPATR
jgi:hypothetical protein